ANAGARYYLSSTHTLLILDDNFWTLIAMGMLVTLFQRRLKHTPKKYRENLVAQRQPTPQLTMGPGIGGGRQRTYNPPSQIVNHEGIEYRIREWGWATRPAHLFLFAFSPLWALIHTELCSMMRSVLRIKMLNLAVPGLGIEHRTREKWLAGCKI